MRELLKHRLRPFRHKSFRNFFFAQGVSLVGTWSHELARAWLVLEIEGTSTALGFLLLSSALPGLFFTLHGGVVADRSDTRRLLTTTKLVLLTSAFTLAAITEFGHVTLWMLVMFSVLEGFVNSFDGPAFTSLFGRLVPREDFRQALAIQSTSFHVSRMLGPSIAGLLMAWHGPSLVFLFDGISYMVVIYALKRVSLREKAPRTHAHPDSKSPSKAAAADAANANALAEVAGTAGAVGIWEGIRFFFATPAMRFKQFQYLLSIVLIIPLVNLVFRSYMKQKFSLDAHEFGYLFSLPAMGAMVGALYMTFLQPKQPIKNLVVGVPALTVLLILVRQAPTPIVAGGFLGIIGLFSYLNIASVTQSLHMDTPDDLRGRLGSLFTLGFMCVGPLMSFPIGVYTDKMGFDAAILHTTILYGGLSLILALFHFRIRPRDVMP